MMKDSQVRARGKPIALAAATAAMALGLLAAPAGAAAPQPPKELGDVKEWGMTPLYYQGKVTPSTQTVKLVNNNSK